MSLEQIIENLSSVLSTGVFQIGGTQVTLGTLLVAGLVIVLTFGLSSLAQRGVRRGMKRRGVVDEGVVDVTNKLLHYVALFVGFGIALRLVGFDLSTLFAAGAIFAVGIGFAMQNIAQNFVSGIILLVERAITPGDVLEVDGRIVKVLRLGIRATIARSRDGEDVIVPNSLLVQSLVRNFTLDDAAYRVRTEVGVTYGSDMRLVRKTLEEVANRNSAGVPRYEAQVLMLRFGNSSVDFEVAIWMDDPWLARRRLSQLNEEIWSALKREGIVIAFPQLDVHFDAPVEGGLGRLAAAS